MHAVHDWQQAAPVAAQGLNGLVAGTHLLTMDGELPVEHLTAGDRIITRDCGMAVLKRVEVSEVRVAPIVVKPGSFGHTRPSQTATILPAQALPRRTR